MVWQTEQQSVLLHCVRCGTFSGELVAPFSDYAVAGILHGIFQPALPRASMLHVGLQTLRRYEVS